MILKIQFRFSVLSITLSHSSANMYSLFCFQIRYFKFKSWRQQVLLCVATTNLISGLTTTSGRGVRERLGQGSDSGGPNIGVVTLLSPIVTYRQLSDNQWDRRKQSRGILRDMKWRNKKNELGNRIVGKFDEKYQCGARWCSNWAEGKVC